MNIEQIMVSVIVVGLISNKTCINMQDAIYIYDRLIFGVLAPLSAIFQLYYGDQF
jgi:hypothetical protein